MALWQTIIYKHRPISTQNGTEHQAHPRSGCGSRNGCTHWHTPVSLSNLQGRAVVHAAISFTSDCAWAHRSGQGCGVLIMDEIHGVAAPSLDLSRLQEERMRPPVHLPPGCSSRVVPWHPIIAESFLYPILFITQTSGFGALQRRSQHAVCGRVLLSRAGSNLQVLQELTVCHSR